MLKIRKSTFESNSSSMHTLVRCNNKEEHQIISKAVWGDFANNNIPSGKYILDYCTFNDKGGYNCFSSLFMKATYLLVYFADLENADNIYCSTTYDSFLNFIQSINPDFEGWADETVLEEGGGSLVHINGNPFKGLTKSEIIETMLDPTIYYFTCDLDNPTLTDLLDTLEYHRSK